MAKRLTGVILICGLLLTPPATATPTRIEITFGTPSVWSLEQAHYLLARVHDLNGSLETKKPSGDDLDPNAFHSTRFNLLRSLVSAQGSFDEGAGLSNQLALDDYRSELVRRDELRARRTAVADQHLAAVRQLTVLRTERTAMAEGDPRIPTQDAAVQAAEAEVAALAAEVSWIDSQLSAQSLGQPTFKSPSGLGTEALTAQEPPTALIDEAAKAAAGLNEKPKLHASMVLENFIQMQYEVLAKQLTLLRDEAGPCKRVLFFELPQSFYPVPRISNDYLAQTRWRITEIVKGKSDCDDDLGEVASRAQSPSQKPRQQRKPMTDRKKLLAARHAELSEHGVSKVLSRMAADLEDLQEWHTVDIIPRRSAFNVTASHGKVKGIALGARLQWLAGFGGGVGLRRQREALERLAEQDHFISGFGKGEETFGWTFAPLPRQERVVPGVSTTYAVIVVPEEAEFVKLKAEGCYYPRKQAPPPRFQQFQDRRRSCTSSESFLLRVPDNDEGFFVEEIRYTPVPQGQTQTLVLLGNFSPQTGVLVDGVPLRRKLSIGGVVQASSQGSQLSPVTAVNGSSELVGEYEMVNRRTLIATFSMGDEFMGTPIISLVTPAKTLPINFFDVRINLKSSRTSLKKLAVKEPMFTRRLSLERLVPLPASRAGAVPGGLLVGNGFSETGGRATVAINGTPIANARVVSPTEIRIDHLPVDATDTWDLKVQAKTDQRRLEASRTVLNPLVPRVTGHEFLRLTFDSSGNPARADVKLKGSGLSKSAAPRALGPGVSVATWTALSDTELYLQLVTPQNPTVLQLDSSSIPGRSSVVSVALPLPPTILSLRPKKGEVEKEHTVVIKGEHLLNVRTVKFGSKPARIVSQTDTTLKVVAPKIKAADAVKVELSTDVVFHGRTLTNDADFHTPGNAEFTYEPKKPEKKEEKEKKEGD